MTPASTASAQLDCLPVTRFHLFVLALGGTGLAFDLYEIGLGSAFGAIFSQPPYEVSSQALSWLLSSVYVGAVLGASLGGWLADRVGRRSVLIGMLWLLAVTAGLAAAAIDVTMLTATRVVMGLTLGAFPPLLTAYLTDLMPVAHRGRLIFATMGFAFLGAPAGVFLIRAMTPLEMLGLAGWRWSLVFGAAGAAACAIAFRKMPESPRWLEALGRGEEAQAVLQRFTDSPVVFAGSGKAVAFQAPAPAVQRDSKRVRFLKFAGLCFLSPWSTAAFPLLTGAILIQKGFRLSDTLYFVGVSTLGPVIGTLVAALAIDRFDRRVSLAALSAAMLAACLAFAFTDTPAWLIVFGTVFSMCSAVYIPMLNVYGAEQFETRVRASAVTGAWAFNRLGAAMAPLLLIPLMRGSGVDAAIGLMAASLVVGVALLALSEPGRNRRAVD